MVKSIVLMGYMGSGKSAVGKRLAALKSLSFIDLDEYIESQEKNTISQIFEQVGESVSYTHLTLPTILLV